jgi:S-DNA-T family DNA segregation ATPase FtsK/SpoIIIE
MEQEIKKLFYDLGIPVFLKKIQESPSYITYHFNVASIKSLEQTEKKTKLISKFLGKQMLYKDSDFAHFALSVPKEENKGVNLADKKYEHLFNKNKIFAGVDENNNPVTIDLEQIPHILIAGTTGSGKSVMMNAVICSLLKGKNKTHSFTMIDTKRVELSPYKNLGNHFCRISTEPSSAIETLEDICSTMDARYMIMEANGWKCVPDSYPREIVVIEELGDLMSISKGVVEQYIVKIARLGRACGIHLIIATQRPTTDVVTGEIKANIGCRFALQTTSSIDSRNILGHNGAEKLRGSGDCLLKLPNKADEIHIQCPFVSDDNILKIIQEF